MAESLLAARRQFVLAEIGVLALLGILLAVIGPFGTGELPLVYRLAYWIGGFLSGWVVMYAILFVTRAVVDLAGLPEILAYLLAIPLLSAGTVMAIALMRGQPESVSLTLYAQICALGLLIFAVFWVLYFRKERAERAGSGEELPLDESLVTASQLHQRLPEGFGPIYALKVEDHYVTVIGRGRRHLLLMNLSEAMAEIDPNAGARIHRAWWVTWSAIAELRQDGRNLVAVLDCGEEAPVSRANVAAVKAGFAKR